MEKETAKDNVHVVNSAIKKYRRQNTIEQQGKKKVIVE
ncbi:hypothetical protein EVA_04632 [gut metagenome]|uniref:Uncharacterized protein n=1 Tax=gut metagenome TaxID=749906 RepID=J9GJ58_9ZZZZ